MEQMFKQFLDQFRTIQNSDIQTSHSSRDLEPVTEVDSAESAAHEQQPSTAPEIPRPEPPTSHVVPHVSKIQQLLDAAEADAAELRAPGQDANLPRTDQDGRDGTAEDLHPCDSNVCEDTGRDDAGGRWYADGFGELDVDSHGQLRYVGLGSTASVAVENCIGLRRYITKGLEKKGYEPEETFLTSPEATHSDEAADASVKQHENLVLPPPELVDVLLSIYTKELAHLFPITTEMDIRHGYHKLLTHGGWDPGHAAAFFALLAVAAPLVPAHSAIFDSVDRKWVNAGPVFYNQAMHFVNLPFNGRNQRKERSQDVVVALGLLSMYLAETGSQAEAWISVGRAIRIAQDIGLHRSPERLRLPREEWNRRRYIWWCLYILERQLCTGKFASA